ncbi:MAG: beta strand repeat-containing protein, partial [Rhodospirillaceae bacterium]
IQITGSHSINVTTDNSGTIQFNDGDTLTASTLSFDDGGVSSGEMVISEGDVLQFSNNFTLDGGSITSDVNSGFSTLALASDGTFTLADRTTIDSDNYFDMSGQLAGSGTLSTDGIVKLDGGIVASTAHLDVDGTATFANASTVAGHLNNDGTVDLTSGTLVLSGELTNNGKLNASGGTLLDINGGTLSGTHLFSSDGEVDFGGGVLSSEATLDANGTATFGNTSTIAGDLINDGKFDLNTGTMIITGQFTNNATFSDGTGSISLNGGTIINNHDLTMDSGNISMTNGQIFNNGTYSIDDSSRESVSGTITNASGAQFDFATTGTVSTTGLTIDNAGTVGFSGGGLVNIQGNVMSSGNWDLYDGSQAAFNATSTLTGGNIFNSGEGPDGTLSVVDHLLIQGGSVNVANDVDFVLENGGTLGSSTTNGTLGIEGDFHFAGGQIQSNLTVYSNGAGVINPASTVKTVYGTLVNDGTMNFNDGTLSVNNGQVNNNAVFNASTGVVIAVSGSGVFNNNAAMAFGSNSDGTVTLNGGGFNNDTGGTVTIGSSANNIWLVDNDSGNFTNKGQFILDGFNSEANDSSDVFFIKSAGTLINTGTIQALDSLGGATGAREINALIDNDGVVKVAQGVTVGSEVTFSSDVTHTNDGTVLLEGTGANLNIFNNGSGDVLFVNTGIIEGTGTLVVGNSTTGADNFDNSAGVLRPGGDGTYGILKIDAGNQVIGGGTIQIDIGGTQAGTSYDQVILEGNTITENSRYVINTGVSNFSDGATYQIASFSANTTDIGDVDFDAAGLYTGTLGTTDAEVVSIAITSNSIVLTGQAVDHATGTTQGGLGTRHYLGSNVGETYGPDLSFGVGTFNTVFLGFGGDDTLSISSASSTPGLNYADGGSGVDTLGVYNGDGGGLSQDFTQDIWRVNSFEILQIGEIGDGTSQTVSLSIDAIQAFDNNTADLLSLNGTLDVAGVDSFIIVTGTNNDTVDVSADGAAWSSNGTIGLDLDADGNNESYTMYQNGSSRLYVADGISVATGGGLD